MSDYYDRQGNPITSERWLELFKDRAYQRVAFTKVKDRRVSTVWLGMDHGFQDDGILIFETMVFGGPEMDEPMWRYTSEEDALTAHDQIVEAIRRGEDITNHDPVVLTK